MIYGLIALFAALISSAWFVVATGASRYSKIAVIVLCLISLTIGFVKPQLGAFGLILQAFLVIGIAMYAKVHTRAR